MSTCNILGYFFALFGVTTASRVSLSGQLSTCDHISYYNLIFLNGLDLMNIE